MGPLLFLLPDRFFDQPASLAVATDSDLRVRMDLSPVRQGLPKELR